MRGFIVLLYTVVGTLVRKMRLDCPSYYCACSCWRLLIFVEFSVSGVGRHARLAGRPTAYLSVESRRDQLFRDYEPDAELVMGLEIFEFMFVIRRCMSGAGVEDGWKCFKCWLVAFNKCDLIS